MQSTTLIYLIPLAILLNLRLLITETEAVYLGIPRQSKRYVPRYSRELQSCRIGFQGPCSSGQKFGSLRRSVSYDPSCEDLGRNCGAVSQTEDKIENCMKILPRINVRDSGERGICIWSNSKHPCKGYPASFRYHRESDKCYSMGLNNYSGKTILESPCNTSTQRFDSSTSVSGECACVNKSEVYWPGDRTCYTLNSQGPCAVGEWLITTADRGLHCEPTLCPRDGLHVSSGSSCWRLHSTGPCKDTEYVYRDEIDSDKLVCIAQPRMNEAVSAHAPKHRCPSGMRLTRDGKCKKSFRSFIG